MERRGGRLHRLHGSQGPAGAHLSRVPERSDFLADMVAQHACPSCIVESDFIAAITPPACARAALPQHHLEHAKARLGLESEHLSHHADLRNGYRHKEAATRRSHIGWHRWGCHTWRCLEPFDAHSPVRVGALNRITQDHDQLGFGEPFANPMGSEERSVEDCRRGVKRDRLLLP